MRLIRSTATLITATLFVALLFALPTYGASTPEYLRNAVEQLIDSGIIPANMAARARLAVANNTTPETTDVTVSVHELIQYSPLEFQERRDVRGIVLLAENSDTAPATLTRTRQCNIVYRIYDDTGTMLYDHSQSNRCLYGPDVAYVLEPNQQAMFEVIHKKEDYPLTPGTYRFEVEYPGYGKGEREVTIVE